MPDHVRPKRSHSADALAEPSGTTASNEQEVDSDELLSLLGDEYTREILTTLGNESLPARKIARQADVSRPTVYRRLNRLEAAGVVETVTSIHPDGHHRQEFRLTLNELALSFENDSLVVNLKEDRAVSESTDAPAVSHFPS